jgi:glycosyltransferase involved in cell wall biosynthesis
MVFIKKLLPNFIKYALWYIFKAPQRKLTKGTLLRDLIGVSVFLKYSLFPVKKLNKITICTGIYNRSAHYLDFLIESINQANHSHLIEISLFDCGSNDIENLKQAVEKKWQGKLVYFSEKVAFSRAYSFNKAVLQSSNHIIFICDADLWLPKNIVKYCNFYASSKRVWYPIFFFLFKNKTAVISKENGVWEQY